MWRVLQRRVQKKGRDCAEIMHLLDPSWAQGHYEPRLTWETCIRDCSAMTLKGDTLQGQLTEVRNHSFSTNVQSLLPRLKICQLYRYGTASATASATATSTSTATAPLLIPIALVSPADHNNPHQKQGTILRPKHSWPQQCLTSTCSVA